MSPACRKTVAIVDAFIDGELPPERVLEVEQHLTECDVCSERVRLADAVRLSTRRAVGRSAIVSEQLKQRVLAALAAERARETAVEHEAHAEREGGRVLSWRVITPIAAAAALTLLYGASVSDSSGGRKATATASVSSAPSVVRPLDSLLDDIVENHVRVTTPSVTDTSLIGGLEPEVGVPVRLPHLDRYGARWEGGSVVPVRNHRAASFKFRVHGHRVTVYVYDATRVHLSPALEARVVADTPVFVGKRRGYSIAAIEKSGVGHALTTDMTGEESAELIVASIR